MLPVAPPVVEVATPLRDPIIGPLSDAVFRSRRLAKGKHRARKPTLTPLDITLCYVFLPCPAALPPARSPLRLKKKPWKSLWRMAMATVSVSVYENQGVWPCNRRLGVASHRLRFDIPLGVGFFLSSGRWVGESAGRRIICPILCKKLRTSLPALIAQCGLSDGLAGWWVVLDSCRSDL